LKFATIAAAEPVPRAAMIADVETELT